MARDKTLWADIRADFLASGLNFADLAKKYGVSYSTLRKTAAAEKWTQQRAEINREAARPRREQRAKKEQKNENVPVPISDEEIIEAKRERLDKFMEITDAMMDRIYDAIQSDKVMNAQAIKFLASALRDLREMQGLNKSALDLEEQQARIAKLRSDTRVVDADGEGGIIFMPTMEARPEPPEDEE